MDCAMSCRWKRNSLPALEKHVTLCTKTTVCSLHTENISISWHKPTKDSSCLLGRFFVKDEICNWIRNTKRRYYIIIYFSHFWPPGFCPLPALYAKFPAWYSDICVSSSTVTAERLEGLIFELVVVLGWCVNGFWVSPSQEFVWQKI